MIKNLSDKLEGHFSLNKARLFCLTQLILGLIKVSTVNLSRLSTAFPGDILPDSKYRKIQRFFAEVSFAKSQLARLVIKFAKMEKGPWDLALDRTNWCYGKTPINILNLSIIRDGTGIPIISDMLFKKGTSNTKERCSYA